MCVCVDPDNDDDDDEKTTSQKIKNHTIAIHTKLNYYEFKLDYL